jgi:predicted Zn-ribbon and HTH transcriptional regulator
MSQTTAQPRQFPCRSCGARLVFAPGQGTLQCPYCKVENLIQAGMGVVEELDFRLALRELADHSECFEALTVRCQACGAEERLQPNVTADRCPFCGSAIVARPASHKLLKPRSLLPFHIASTVAMKLFGGWIESRWFAPSDLKNHARAGGLKGVYIPYWTYDCSTWTRYTGQRGDDYWETETYTTTENGRSVTRTRQVRRTRWRSVSGTVTDSFDDVLVLASHSLPHKYTESLEPWDLKNLVPYNEEFLAGFIAESYQVGLEEGFENAKAKMDPQIRRTICRDIGGDHQRIHSMSTHYQNITFKHILLPLWISAYRYHDRVFRFLINARTGEVCGERPYSFWKIALFVLLLWAAAAAALFVFLAYY